MALIQCPECHHENVSDSAPTCPYCGFEIKKYCENIRNQEIEETRQNQQTEINQLLNSVVTPIRPKINKATLIIGIICMLITFFCCLYPILFPFTILFLVAGISLLIFTIYKFDKQSKSFVLAQGNYQKQKTMITQNIKKQEQFLNTTSATTLPEPFTPHCPTCGSTDIEKISVASKVGKTAAFGVFSIGSNSKTFRCKHCGYKW